MKTLRHLILTTLTLGLLTACVTTPVSTLPTIPDDLSIYRSDDPESLPEDMNRWVRHFWERRAEFAEENAALDPEISTVVLLGDSLTEGWKHADRIENYLPEGHHYLNRGITSDHVLGDDLGILRRLEDSVYNAQPSHIFFMMGANDLARCGGNGGVPSVDRIFGAYHLAVNGMQETCPDAVICLVTTTPASGRYEFMTPWIMDYNELVKQLAEEKGLPIIDLFALVADENNAMPGGDMSGDGLHFGNPGFELYGVAIAEVLAGE